MARQNSFGPPSARMRSIKANIVRATPMPPRPEIPKPPKLETPKKPAHPPEQEPVLRATSEPEVTHEPVSEVAPEPVQEPERVREDDGRYAPDDPSTPDVNEAFVGGKAPSWSHKDRKADLLVVVEKAGIEGLSMDNTKAELIAALEEAGV